MSPVDFLRRRGLAAESSSTFSSLGLTSSLKSERPIRTAHAVRKGFGHALQNPANDGIASVPVSSCQQLVPSALQGSPNSDHYQPALEEPPSTNVFNSLALEGSTLARKSGKHGKVQRDARSSGHQSGRPQPRSSALRSALISQPMTYATPETMSFARGKQSVPFGTTPDAEFLAVMAGLNRLMAAGVSGEEMPQTFEELDTILRSNRLGAVFEDKAAWGCNGSTATPSEASLPEI